MPEVFDVVIIGAGHVGLTASALLKKAGVKHVILEKSQIANSWKTERWDSFRLVLPNWTVNLPDFPYAGNDPDGFMDRTELVQHLEKFARTFELPIREGIQVQRLERAIDDFFLTTSAGILRARHVIVATGGFQKPSLPKWSEELPAQIDQMHSSQYKNPAQLSAKRILVVGAGQSGAQIADELHASGKKVFLSVSRCGGRPRRYRGKDSTWWMERRGYFEQKADATQTAGQKLGCHVPLTGHNGGYDIDLYDFQRKGIELLGRIEKANGALLQVAPDLEENLKYAATEWSKFLNDCDQFATENNLNLPAEPEAHRKLQPVPFQIRAEINLKQEGIEAVIYATGFQLAFDWIALPIFAEAGYPQQRNGLTTFPGLYFLGLPWLTTRKSSLLLGAKADAEYVISHIQKSLKTHF